MAAITKDEFLDRFIEMSGIPKSCRTPDGVKEGSFERIAMPCDCGEFLCPDWHFVKPDKRKITVR